jgi:hypothetical protein
LKSGEAIGEVLKIGERDLGERLPCPGKKSGDIGAVSSLGMRRVAVKPDCDELLIGGGLRRGRGMAERLGNRDFGAHWGQHITNTG